MVVVKAVNKGSDGRVLSYSCEDGYSSQTLTKEQLASLIQQGLVENARLYYREGAPCIRVYRHKVNIESPVDVNTNINNAAVETASGILAKLNDAMFDLMLQDKNIILNKCKINSPVIDIPYGVTSLLIGCFDGLNKVQTVIIPTSCREIGAGVFDTDATSSITTIICAETTQIKCRNNINIIWLQNIQKKNIAINKSKKNGGAMTDGAAMSMEDKIAAIKNKKKHKK